MFYLPVIGAIAHDSSVIIPSIHLSHSFLFLLTHNRGLAIMSEPITLPALCTLGSLNRLQISPLHCSPPFHCSVCSVFFVCVKMHLNRFGYSFTSQTGKMVDDSLYAQQIFSAVTIVFFIIGYAMAFYRERYPISSIPPLNATTVARPSGVVPSKELTSVVVSANGSGAVSPTTLAPAPTTAVTVINVQPSSSTTSPVTSAATFLPLPPISAPHTSTNDKSPRATTSPPRQSSQTARLKPPSARTFPFYARRLGVLLIITDIVWTTDPTESLGVLHSPAIDIIQFTAQYLVLTVLSLWIWYACVVLLFFECGDSDRQKKLFVQ